jgi:hypothetical protein
MGFFTDAHDLFVIGIASTLIAKEWNLRSGKVAVLNRTMPAAAFLGALVFGRFADVAGRKRVYWMVAAIQLYCRIWAQIRSLRSANPQVSEPHALRAAERVTSQVTEPARPSTPEGGSGPVTVQSTAPGRTTARRLNRGRVLE